MRTPEGPRGKMSVYGHSVKVVELGVELRPDCVQTLTSSQPPVFHLDLLHQTYFCPPLSLSLCPQVSLSPFLSPLPEVILSSLSLSPGQLRAPALETPLVRSLWPLPLLLQGSVLLPAWGDGRPSHTPFPLASGPSDLCVTP